MADPRLTLVCFAVKQEAKPFERAAKGKKNLHVAVTGMGRQNAHRAIRDLVERYRPHLVVSSGFAGGLKPDLVAGTVVFATETASELAPSLIAAGACPARFICSGRVATLAIEKAALRKSTGADAIEMESEVISAFCRERQIPSATIRVILDAAHEDLALDFNQLVTTDQQLDRGKLLLALIKSPHKIPALGRLQKRAATAAEHLAAVLTKVLLR
jgi:adenosylhomocysteine nucleosidase